MKAEIIATTRIYAPTQERLDREFSCHKLHEARDRAGFLRDLAPKVRALATFGPAGADAALMDALPKLEIISNFGVGVDAIDLDAAKKRKIIVTNTPDVLNDCVADTALALTLNMMRKFARAEEYLRAGQWAAKGGYPLATALGGKVMGILGLGRIGEAIARRAQAFGMRIRYHNRNRKDVPYPYDADAVALARNSDVVMVVTPGGPQTEKLVGAKVLDALGAGGYLVNIARGSVVDEPVLLKYLQERKIAGAGLDVFADEPRVPPAFFTLDNAVLLPHVGSATVETRTAMGNLQVDNLLAHFAGKPVLTRVV